MSADKRYAPERERYATPQFEYNVSLSSLDVSHLQKGDFLLIADSKGRRLKYRVVEVNPSEKVARFVFISGDKSAKKQEVVVNGTFSAGEGSIQVIENIYDKDLERVPVENVAHGDCLYITSQQGQPPGVWRIEKRMNHDSGKEETIARFFYGSTWPDELEVLFKSAIVKPTEAQEMCIRTKSFAYNEPLQKAVPLKELDDGDSIWTSSQEGNELTKEKVIGREGKETIIEKTDAKGVVNRRRVASDGMVSEGDRMIFKHELEGTTKHVLALGKTDDMKLETIQNVLFDLAKAFLTPEEQDSLDMYDTKKNGDPLQTKTLCRKIYRKLAPRLHTDKTKGSGVSRLFFNLLTNANDALKKSITS